MIFTHRMTSLSISSMQTFAPKAEAFRVEYIKVSL